MYYETMMILIWIRMLNTLICEMVETGQFHLACRGRCRRTTSSPSHGCWLWPFSLQTLSRFNPAFLLVGIKEGVGGLFGAMLVAEIIEVETFYFFYLWLRLLIFLFRGAHNFEIYMWDSEEIYQDMCPGREYIEDRKNGQLSKKWSQLIGSSVGILRSLIGHAKK